MREVQRLGVGETSCVARRKPPAISNLDGQCAGRHVEHHSTSLVGTLVCDRACCEVSIHEVGEIPIEISKTVWQVFAQALEHFSYVLVEPRLDDLRCPLVFLFVSVPAL